MARTLTLLIVTQVYAEWVEISQQHYRKPLRTYSPLTTTERAIEVEDTTKSWTYNNRSVTEYNWNKNPAISPSLGNVKRIKFGSTIKTTDRTIFEDEYPDLDSDIVNYDPDRNYPSITSIAEHDKHKGAIVKVSNLGNIERVQLNNSPVKSPVINFKGNEEKTLIDRHKNASQENLDAEVNEFDVNRKIGTINRRIYVNEVKKQHGTDRRGAFPPDYDDSSHFSDQVTTSHKEELQQDYRNRTSFQSSYATKPSFITETKNIEEEESHVNRFYKFTNSKSSEVTDKFDSFTTERIKGDEKVSTNKNNKPPSMLKGENSATIDHINKINKDTNFKDVPHVNMATPEQETKTEKVPPKQNKDQKEHTAKENKTNESNKLKTIENVVKFMRVIADTMSKNSRRSFSGKMQYLRELKDSLLANIAERIDSTWPDDDSGVARRRSRSTHTSPRGHVHLASSENALMTISFLTFAVFLIKLVLQVIQTYKHKAMMVAPLVVASSGRNMLAQYHLGQH